MLRRAAQYVRMSTDQQRYSIDNQKLGIALYAEAHGLQIVKTYEDPGRSGLTLKGRPGLQALLSDVSTADTGYDILLVYDVSRWGRFQDADESAYYAHLCLLAGVEIVYCAEPFQGIDGPFSAVFKSMKRAMAAEYSRELSSKVFRGQVATVKRGFRAGGPPPFGLQRWAANETNRAASHALDPGQSKDRAEDRVILKLGPAEETGQVRLIFRLCADQGLYPAQIARALADRGLLKRGRPWTARAVRKILSEPQYAGDHIFNRTNSRLGRTVTPNPPADWIRYDQAWEPIVSAATFARARMQTLKRAHRHWTEAEALEALRRLQGDVGKLSTQIVRDSPDVPSLTALKHRFGSLREAFARAGHHNPRRDRQDGARQLQRELRKQILEALSARLTSMNAAHRTMRRGLIETRGVKAQVVLPTVRMRLDGRPSWEMRVGGDLRLDVVIAARRAANDRNVVDYYVLPVTRSGQYAVVLRQGGLDAVGVRCEDLRETAEALCRLRRPYPIPSQRPRLSGAAQNRYRAAMSSPAERLKEARIAAGYSSAAAAAEHLSVPLATYQQHENGIRGFPAKRAERYGTAFGVDPAWLIYGTGQQSAQKGPLPKIRYVPIVGAIARGVWSAPDSPATEGATLPMHLPQFDGEDLFALTLHDRSMDHYYPPGSIVVVRPLLAAQLREGDHVVTRKRRGTLVELSAWAAMRAPEGLALWPRSQDKGYQSPLVLRGFTDSEAPELLGAIVASCLIRPPSVGPVLQIA